MNLKEKVRMLRLKREMNQKDLADATGIKQATISRIESGEIEGPRLGVLSSLANALGVTVDFLVGQTDEMTPSDILKTNPKAKYLFRGYEKLSEEGKKDLRDFLGWLEQREKKEKKGKG